MANGSEWFDLHTHTALCGHARGRPQEYVEAAARRGIGRMAVTCHMPFDEAAFGGPRMRMFARQFPQYLQMVDEAREAGERLGVEVLAGIEGEVFPEADMQARLGEVIGSYPFDFVLGSVHHHMPAFQKWFSERGCVDDSAIVCAYFEALREGAATGLFHSMSHPDVIRLYGTLAGDFQPEEYEDVIRAAISSAVENDVCWEVNTSGRLKGPGIEHPDPLIRKWGSEMGLKLTIGSDAHRPQSVGQYFREVTEDLAREGYSHLYYFKGGERQAVAIADLLASDSSRGVLHRHRVS